MDIALTPSVNRVPAQAKLLDRAQNEQNLVAGVDYVRYFPNNSVELRWGEGSGFTAGENLPTSTIRIVGNSLADLASSYLAMDVKITQDDGTLFSASNGAALQAGGWSLWREIRVSAGGKTIHHLRNVPQLAGVLYLGGATRSWAQSADAKAQGWCWGHGERETVADGFVDLANKGMFYDTTANNGQGNTLYLPLSHLLGIAGDKYMYLRGVTDLTIELVPARIQEAVVLDKENTAAGCMVKVNNLRCVVRSVDMVSSYYQAMDAAVASGTGLHYVIDDFDSQTQNYSYSATGGQVNLNYPITGKYIKHLYVGSVPTNAITGTDKLSSIAWFRDNARDFQVEFRGKQYPSYQVPSTVEMYQMFKQAFGTDASVYHDDVIDINQIINNDATGVYVGDKNQMTSNQDPAADLSQNVVFATRLETVGEAGVGALTQKVTANPAFVQAYIFDPSKFSDGAASGVSTNGSANNALVRFTKGDTSTCLNDYAQPSFERIAYGFIHRNKIVKIQNLAVDVEM